jgi:hypothetical protein
MTQFQTQHVECACNSDKQLNRFCFLRPLLFYNRITEQLKHKRQSNLNVIELDYILCKFLWFNIFNCPIQAKYVSVSWTIIRAIPVTGLAEIWKLAGLLSNWLADGGEGVLLTCRPRFTPRKIPGTNFCYRPNLSQGYSATGIVRSTEKFNDLFGNRIRCLPNSSIAPLNKWI